MSKPITKQTFVYEARDKRQIKVVIEGKEKPYDDSVVDALFTVFDFKYGKELRTIVEDNLQLIKDRIKSEGKTNEKK